MKQKILKSKKRIFINIASFVLFNLVLFLYANIVDPMIGSSLALDYYENRIASVFYMILPPLIFSVIIFVRWVLIRQIPVKKNKMIPLIDAVELLLSILVAIIIARTSLGTNGFIYIVFYCASCLATVISDLIYRNHCNVSLY